MYINGTVAASGNGYYINSTSSQVQVLNNWSGNVALSATTNNIIASAFLAVSDARAKDV